MSPLAEGIIQGVSFLTAFVVLFTLMRRSTPGMLRLLAYWVQVSSKRMVWFLRLSARQIEQARRRNDWRTRRMFRAEKTARLRGPKRRPLEPLKVTLETDTKGFQEALNSIKGSILDRFPKESSNVNPSLADERVFLADSPFARTTNRPL